MSSKRPSAAVDE
jgi:hypothetical protein